ncbi:MAG: hypothetical protein JW726_15795 [Anaerolineales bacterium]|nr:hypothetical protein [Anaerolineales bacterium]
MEHKITLRTLVFVWMGWFLVLYGFQWLVSERLQVKQPDYAVSWTGTETLPSSNRGKIYLLEPFLNRQVAWDSEYYLGIAVGGYDDPAAGKVNNPFTGQDVIKNYSFFPLYPYAMKVFMLPLGLFGLNPIATASLAGVVVALLGTLAGMIALWDLTRDYLEDQGALRAVFYMLIFPTGFFLAQVYTEGLFIGLAFGALALSRRKQWLWASLLAGLAAWARAHGAALVLPLGVACLTILDWKKPLLKQLTWKWLAQALCALLPLAAYLVWRISPLGEGWAELQSFYFGRGVMSIEKSLKSWADGWFYARYMCKGGEGLVYFGIEVFSVLLALIASFWALRRDLPLGLFSLAVVVLSGLSGSAQSLARYVVVAPAIFVFLAWLGRSKAFDRTWTILSLLLMGMSAMLFSFDMWVG